MGAAMLTVFYCSECRAKLEIDADAGGSRIQCPQCRAALTVPDKRVGPGATVGGFRVEKLLGTVDVSGIPVCSGGMCFFSGLKYSARLRNVRAQVLSREE